MGQGADYKTGGIANAKRLIEGHKREIERCRKEMALNKDKKDSYKRCIEYHKKEIEEQKKVIANWKKR